MTAGVSLSTNVTVSIHGDKSLSVRYAGPEDTDEKLVHACLETATERGWMKGDSGVDIRIETEIPPSRGMKSSSSVAIALLIALAAASGQHLPENELLRLSAETSIAAGVSVTGAYDDAAACHYGGLIFADNSAFQIIRREKLSFPLTVLFTVPERRMPKRDLPVDRLKGRREEFLSIFRLAASGKLREAALCNSFLLCNELGISTEPLYASLSAGALLCGLSGTGPSFYAIVGQDHERGVTEALQPFGKIMKTTLRGCGADGIAL